MKRILSFLLAVIMVAMMIPLTIISADYRTASAPFVSKALEVDGKKDDVYGAAFSVGTSADPVRGNAYFAHDGNFLYVYVDVEDKTAAPLRADKKEIIGGDGGNGFANLRANDGVTVGINFGKTDMMNNTVTTITDTEPAESALYCAERGGVNDGIYYAGRQAFAPMNADWTDAKGNAINFWYYSYTTVETDGGYAVEMRIPFGRDASGKLIDVEALANSGFSVLVQLTESNIDANCKNGDTAPLGTFVSSNPAYTEGLSVWCAHLRSYETGWDKIEIGKPDMSLVEKVFPEGKVNTKPVTTTTAPNTPSAPMPEAGTYRTATADFTSSPTLDGEKDEVYGEAFSDGDAKYDPVYGNAYFAHDGEYLYVFVDVTDKTAAPIKADKAEVVGGTDGTGFANLRCNDGVTVGINFGTTTQMNNVVSVVTDTEPAEAAIYCLERGRISEDGRYFAGRHAFAPANADYSDANGNPMNFLFYSATSVETDDGYTVEMRIPFGRDVNGLANDVYALSQSGFSFLVQLTESNIDENYKEGDKAPMGTFVSSNRLNTQGLSIWCANLRSYEDGWDKMEIAAPGDSTVIDDPANDKPGTVIKEINFDKLTAFQEDIDFTYASYSAEHVKLSNKYDHTTGSGKSLEMGTRTMAAARTNLMNIFTEDQRGMAMRVTAWIYVPGQDAEIRLSSYTPSSYGIENVSVLCEADTWTKVSFIHKHTDVQVSLLGISQLPDKEIAPIIYIDDIVITDVTESVEMPELDIQVKHNGNIVTFGDVLPEVIKTTVYLPLEDVFKALNSVVRIDGNNVSILRGSDEVNLVIGEKTAKINGETVELKNPTWTSGDSVMMPLDLIEKSFDVTVEWNPTARVVNITSEPKNVLSIYREYEKQEIYGFGASISPGAYGLMTMENQEMQKQILDSLYGYEGKGAGFSLLRFTIQPKLEEERADNGVNSGGGTINPAEGVWDFDIFDPQTWVADRALEYNPDITFLASTWSPPAWMKTNNNVIGQTELPNKLAPEHYDDYVLYLAKWAELYRSTYGYNLKYLSVQNEPYINAWYESCLWSGDELLIVTDKLVDKLAEMGLSDVLVGAPEGGSIQESYGFMNVLKNSKMGFIPTHSYSADYGVDVYDLSQFGLPVIQTEYNYSYKEPRMYTIVEGLKTANIILDCLNNGYGGFLYWYGHASFTGTRPQSAESLMDWNPKTNELHYSKDFYVMAQFSRFFRPGDHIVVSFSENEDVEIVSCVSAETGKVSAVVINNSSKPVTMEINGMQGTVDVYVTDNNKGFDKVDSVSQSELEAYSFNKKSITLLTEVDTPASSGGNTEQTTTGEGAQTTTNGVGTGLPQGGADVAVIVVIAVAAVAIIAVGVILIFKRKK